MLAAEIIRLLLCVIVVSVSYASSLRILMLPAMSGGHMAPFAGLAEELDKQGHRVFTVAVINESIKIHPALNAPPNRTLLKLGVKDESLWDHTPEKFAMNILEKGFNIRSVMKKMTVFVEKLTNNLLMDNEPLFDEMAKLNLDLAIVDDLVGLHYHHLVPHRLGIPAISLIHFIDPIYHRVPHLPSFVPSPFLPYSDHMTFTERLTNLFFVIGMHVFPIVPQLPDRIHEKYSKYGHFDSVEDIGRKALLCLHVADPALDFPLPLMPHVVQVGPLSAKTTKKPLDTTLENFVKGAKHGVIVMSFGSSVVNLPQAIAVKYVTAFKRIPEKIIWRFGNEANLEIPDNVFISQWIPQNELLDLPETRLFITHCGNNGQQEAVAHGVPMIAFPISNDQGYNAARAERRGFSITMDIHTFTPEQLVENIRKVIDDAGYKQRTMEAAEIIAGRTQTPAEKAVYWIDHVMRHRSYLRSPALDMDLYKLLMIDLFVVITVVFVVFVCVIYFCVRCVCHGCKFRKQKTD